MGKTLDKDYIEQTILEIIANLQMGGSFEIPALDGEDISNIAEDFIYEWGQTGDFSADLEETLTTFIQYRFTQF